MNDKNNIISSRIRLARNFDGVPFSPKLTPEKRTELIEEIHGKLKKENPFKLNHIEMSNVSSIQAGAMVEEHLISLDFANDRSGKALLLSDDKHISAMLCEEDHLRLQVISDKDDLRSLWEKATQVDDWFNKIKPYAFSEELGYLTACPTNLGTGLRASVMLHLPALTESGHIRKFINAASNIGLTVRGMYGEGSEPNGALYQISNRVTMGISEEETLERLITVTEKIIENEKTLSEKMLKNDQLRDRISRAEGILRYATVISSAEFINLVSDVRWGSEQGLNGINVSEIDKLFTKVQPYTVMLYGGEDLNGIQRDKKRADILRDTLKDL